MIKVECDRCGDELDEPGALLFGPPVGCFGQEEVAKLHLCILCADVVLDEIESFRARYDWQ